MHHNQHMGSLMVAIHLLLVKVIRQLDTPRAVDTHLLKATHRVVDTLHLLKVTPRVVHILRLVLTLHKVRTPQHRAPTLQHKATLASKEHTTGEIPLLGNQIS